MPATSLYPSTIAFALCFSLSLRRAGDPPCPRHSERPLFVPQRRSACQPLPLIPPTMPDRAAPRQTASEYAGESSGKAVWANPAQNPVNPRPYPGQPPTKPRPTPAPTPDHTPDQPPANPRPTHGQPPRQTPANPRPTPGGQPVSRHASPLHGKARRSGIENAGLHFHIHLRFSPPVYLLHCRKPAFVRRSVSRTRHGLARPPYRGPYRGPSRRNRAGGGNVQEKDPLRGAQDTKEDAYGDDERGA